MKYLFAQALGKRRFALFLIPRQNITKTLLTLLTLILSCASLKPLSHTTTTNPCEYCNDARITISKIHNDLKRYNPVISKSILLIPNYGSPKKTLTVYTYRKNRALERVLLFHFSDQFNFELQLDSLLITGDGLEIRKPIYDDASVMLSNIQDLIFYVQLSETEFEKLLAGGNVVFRIDEMELRLKPECKTLLAVR